MISMSFAAGFLYVGMGSCLYPLAEPGSIFQMTRKYRNIRRKVLDYLQR